MTKLGHTCHVPHLNETPITVKKRLIIGKLEKTPEALRDEGPKTDNNATPQLFDNLQTERKDRVMAEGQFVSLL